MSNMLLEAKEIHTYYGASHILHGIDFNIREGEGTGCLEAGFEDGVTVQLDELLRARERLGKAFFANLHFDASAAWVVDLLGHRSNLVADGEDRLGGRRILA